MKIIFDSGNECDEMFEAKCPKDILSSAKELLECVGYSQYPHKCADCWKNSGIELEVKDEV